MPGPVFTRVVEVAREQHGYVRVSDLREIGIDPKRLVDYRDRGLAEKRAHGLYRINMVPLDDASEFMEAALWPDGRGCLSHETALDLWDLCDVNPDHIDVTVPRAYRTHRQVPRGYRLHRGVLDEGDRTSLNGLPVVTPAAAIRQGIEIGLRPSLINQAIGTARAQALMTDAAAGGLLQQLEESVVCK